MVNDNSEENINQDHLQMTCDDFSRGITQDHELGKVWGIIFLTHMIVGIPTDQWEHLFMMVTLFYIIFIVQTSDITSLNIL